MADARFCKASLRFWPSTRPKVSVRVFIYRILVLSKPLLALLGLVPDLLFIDVISTIISPCTTMSSAVRRKYAANSLHI